MADKFKLKFQPKKNLHYIKKNSSQIFFYHHKEPIEEKKIDKKDILPLINSIKNISHKLLGSQECINSNNIEKKTISPNIIHKKRLSLQMNKDFKINDNQNILSLKKTFGHIPRPNQSSKLKLGKGKNRSNLKLKNPLNNIFQSNLEDNNKILEKNTQKIKKYSPLKIEIITSGKNYATKTQTGIEEDGKEKENNQDSILFLEKIFNLENFDIFSVMDGHGTNGHFVSSFVKTKMQEYFTNKKTYKLKFRKASAGGDNNIYIEANTIYDKLKYNDYEIIRNFYKQVNDELYDAIFDIHFSGCTCVIIFRIGNKIICSNVGDSRAILVKENNICVELSHDHKPEIKEEKERIEKMGGEVAKMLVIEKEGDEGKPSGIYRVWKKGYDYPGIAISRSLGDKIAELIGVTYEPDILEFNLDNECKFIVTGSDGIFEYLSNQDVSDIVDLYFDTKNPELACYDLVERSTKLWKKNEKRVDDISVCVYYL